MQLREKIFLIDDDLIQLKVTGKMIEQTIPGKTITPFQEAKIAINYLQAHQHDPVSLPDTILLDLNMPEMNGWDFLDAFEDMQEHFAKKIDVYIVTSSPDESDINKSETYASVLGYIIKPLTKEKILSLF